jgi:frataxin-like iron-binding protein CyaY
MSRNFAMQILEKYADTLENDFDLDLDGDFLKITHPKGQFLLNYHPTLDQLWLASPLTGAHHFRYENIWLCTRTGKTLEEILLKDLYA